jgi:branched-chain amino acid transport system ATP-binding protein
MAGSPLLAVEGVSAFYDRFRALDEIVSIIGANGAGAGENIPGRPTAAIVAAGIVLAPEGRRLFASLTVEENLRLARDVGRKGEFGFDAL